MFNNEDLYACVMPVIPAYETAHLCLYYNNGALPNNQLSLLHVLLILPPSSLSRRGNPV